MLVPLPSLIGSIGVALLLLAFFASIQGFLGTSSRTYFALNATGAVLACFSSCLIGFLPFAILEGVWTIVALRELLRAPGRR